MKIEKISRQVFTKNQKFQIIEKISDKDNNKYVYKRKIKCTKCGLEQIVSLNHIERCVCQNCKKQELLLSYEGKTFGNYTILKYHSVENMPTYIRKLFLVKCNICGSESIQDLSNILSSPKSCSICKYDIRFKNNPPKLISVRNCIKSTYISGAKNRGLEFTLSDNKFDELISGDCVYCGAHPSEYQSDKKFNKTDEIFKRNGIDRIDSNKGYTDYNCVSCCEMCNRMKSDYTVQDFIGHIENIHTFLVNKGSTTISKESTLQANGNGNGGHPTILNNIEDDDIV